MDDSFFIGVTMFFLVLYHEPSEVEAVYLVQADDKSEIPYLTKRSMEHCIIMQIPEPVWQGMLYTEKLVYRVIR